MPLLKAYRNLDLRPASVDSLGRLTSEEERRIRSGLVETYGEDRLDLPYEKFDLALARSRGCRPNDLVVTMRAKELPATRRTAEPDSIVGAMIGHLASIEDKRALIAFRPLRHTAALRPQLDEKIMRTGSVLMIDVVLDMGPYPVSSMMAFLFRKLQASAYGKCLTVLCWRSTKIDVNLGTQFVQFGYKPYGIGDFATIPGGALKTGRCLAMWANRTLDQREIR